VFDERHGSLACFLGIDPELAQEGHCLLLRDWHFVEKIIDPCEKTALPAQRWSNRSRAL